MRLIKSIYHLELSTIPWHRLRYRSMASLCISFVCIFFCAMPMGLLFNEKYLPEGRI